VGTALLTIGHSNHSPQRFLELLRAADVERLADVRTVPFSRRLPHFCRGALEAMLGKAGIDYLFLGAELGGRPARPELYSAGVADYERMATEATFRAGLERVSAFAAGGRAVVLCAEREPLDCHRCLLVGRRLAEAGARVAHILADGTIERHAATEARLLAATGRAGTSLLCTPSEDLAAAYRTRARRVAFRQPRIGVPAGQSSG